MNRDLSSTESVADNLENIPEIEVAFFHQGFFCFFAYSYINGTIIWGIWSSGYSCQLSGQTTLAVTGRVSVRWFGKWKVSRDAKVLLSFRGLS